MAFLKFNKAELVNLGYSLKREIILANKTGAYCSTSIVTCNTRRYHGLLGVPVDRLGGKYLLLSSLDESVTLRGKRFNLGIHCYGDIYDPRGHKYIVDFDADPVPQITYKIGEIIFRKSIVLVPDNDQVLLRYELVSAPSEVSLQIKPFLAFRRTHDLTHENPEARTEGWDIDRGVAFNMYDGFPDLNLQISDKDAVYRSNPYWYKGVTYSDEYRRGFDCREDLFVPGYFETVLKPGDNVVFSAAAEEPVNASQLRRKFTSAVGKIGPITSFYDQLVRSADLFIRNRGGRKRIIAGFSWGYTGLLRETLISLAGLTLYGKDDPKEYEEILDNLIADEQERLFHRTTQVEAPLYMAITLQQYIAYTGREKHCWEKYGETLKGIIASYAPGVRAEVAMQPNGLLWAQMDGVALSWMNAYINGRAVTERAGYQVETNAMWYNAVSFALEMEAKYGKTDFTKTWAPVRELIAKNFQPLFWNPDYGFLADYVDNAGQHMELRPNQLWAISMDYCPVDDEILPSVMRVISSELETRRGIRTLSPRDGGYKGVYEGSQIDRDLAFHNGCSFPFLLAQYCYANFRMKGSAFIKKAEWLTEGFYEDLSMHGVGAFSELYDGDPPHEAHGLISSALSTAALLNVQYLIEKYRES